jgi:hypothetical protein
LKLPKEYSLEKLVGVMTARVEYERNSCISFSLNRRSAV